MYFLTCSSSFHLLTKVQCLWNKDKINCTEQHDATFDIRFPFILPEPYRQTTNYPIHYNISLLICLLVASTRALLLCMPKKHEKYRRWTFQRYFSILACTIQSFTHVHMNKPLYFVASRCDWNWVRSRVKTLLIKHSPTWNKEMCITGTKCLAEETRVTVDKVLN